MISRSITILVALLLTLGGAAQSTHTVEVFVKGLRSEEGGVLYLQLLNAAGEQVQAVKLPIDRSVVLHHFTSVPAGTYAARCYADVNGNAQLDLGFMGIPKEAVGSSNNAKGFLSAPKLKDMLFTVDRATTISFEVTYY